MEKLNESLLEQFSMEELEQRLETDPLAAGQLLRHSCKYPWLIFVV